MYLAWFKVAIIKRLPVIQMPQRKGKTAFKNITNDWQEWFCNAKVQQ